MPELNMDLPRADVLGIGVHAVNMAKAVQRSLELLDSGGRGYVCLTGVHGVMESQDDPRLRAILNRAYMCLPDGTPTVWIGRLQGHCNMSRVYGPDYMLEMCRESQERGDRHFLYGGAPGVVEQLAVRLRQRMHRLNIVGTFTPPYGPLNAEEENRLTGIVARSKPDIFWVGLSTPKQEHFMATYLDRLDVKLMVGGGAAFDLHAGLRPDAPQWVKHCGLQWLHRFAQEPSRLGPRYLKHNPRFLRQICRQMLREKECVHGL
jgi:N-acetylglucosaminyldiphosphoundecaprenol N-acetyl-beta-D-mannosaminyltransferase